MRLKEMKEMLGRLYARRRRDVGSVLALESRAARTVREYLEAHAANLERAVRLEEKADRLEKDGIPSESARYRAQRARGEVVAGLAAQRASFVEATGKWEGAHAFDRAVELLCPAFVSRRQLDLRTR